MRLSAAIGGLTGILTGLVFNKVIKVNGFTKKLFTILLGGISGGLIGNWFAKKRLQNNEIIQPIPVLESKKTEVQKTEKDQKINERIKVQKELIGQTKKEIESIKEELNTLNTQLARQIKIDDLAKKSGDKLRKSLNDSPARGAVGFFSLIKTALDNFFFWFRIEHSNPSVNNKQPDPKTEKIFIEKCSEFSDYFNSNFHNKDYYNLLNHLRSPFNVEPSDDIDFSLFLTKYQNKNSFSHKNALVLDMLLEKIKQEYTTTEEQGIYKLYETIKDADGIKSKLETKEILEKIKQSINAILAQKLPSQSIQSKIDELNKTIEIKESDIEKYNYIIYLLETFGDKYDTFFIIPPELGEHFYEQIKHNDPENRIAALLKTKVKDKIAFEFFETDKSSQNYGLLKEGITDREVDNFSEKLNPEPEIIKEKRRFFLSLLQNSLTVRIYNKTVKLSQIISFLENCFKDTGTLRFYRTVINNLTSINLKHIFNHYFLNDLFNSSIEKIKIDNKIKNIMMNQDKLLEIVINEFKNNPKEFQEKILLAAIEISYSYYSDTCRQFFPISGTYDTKLYKNQDESLLKKELIRGSLNGRTVSLLEHIVYFLGEILAGRTNSQICDDSESSCDRLRIWHDCQKIHCKEKPQEYVKYFLQAIGIKKIVGFNGHTAHTTIEAYSAETQSEKDEKLNKIDSEILIIENKKKEINEENESYKTDFDNYLKQFDISYEDFCSKKEAELSSELKNSEDKYTKMENEKKDDYLLILAQENINSIKTKQDNFEVAKQKEDNFLVKEHKEYTTSKLSFSQFLEHKREELNLKLKEKETEKYNIKEGIDLEKKTAYVPYKIILTEESNDLN